VRDLSDGATSEASTAVILAHITLHVGDACHTKNSIGDRFPV
jgi:hypothetical protein